MTLQISGSQTVSPKTVHIMLKAIKKSNENTHQLKLTQRHREQRLIFVVVFLAALNLCTLLLANFSPQEGTANAVGVGSDQVDTVLQNLKSISPQTIMQDNDANIFTTGSTQSKLQNSQPLKSKITLLDDPEARLEKSYYGELMPQSAIKTAEQAGRVPHTSDLGEQIGTPAPAKSNRIEALVRNRIPLSTQETLYLKKLVDDNERAIYATPDVQQRAIKIEYVEGKIPTITVAKNNIATLSFVDKFGNPFAISTMSPKGSGELFTTELINHEGTHANVAEIRASKLNGSSNVSLMLEGRTLPAVFKVNLSQTINDARTVIHLDSLAPGFEHVSLPASTQSVQLCKNDEYMEAVLDGVIPHSLQRLETRVEFMQAYRSTSHHYIRSAHQIVDPECTCRIYGVDNLNVCKQPISIPSILYVDSSTDEFGSLTLNREA